MKKRNRRRKTLQLKLATIGWGILFFIPFVPWVHYSLVNLENDQITNKIKILEQEKRSYEESLRRQTAEWNQYIEPARLGEAIADQGLRLNYALPENCVHVAQNGKMKMPAALVRSLMVAQKERTTKDVQASVSGNHSQRRRVRR